MRAVSGVARRLRCERGFTLIELMWYVVLSLIVLALPMAFILTSLAQQNVSSSRTVAATQEQLGLDRLIRDMRQVVPSTTTTLTWGTTSASVTATIPVPGTGGASTEPVTWSCTFANSGTCTRSVNSGSAIPEIRNVESVSFAPIDSSGNVLGGASSPYTASNPAYVTVTVKVLAVSQLDATATPSHVVSGIQNWLTLQGGVDLRSNTL